VSRLAVDTTVPDSHHALVIEDDLEAERVAKEMTAAGCTVEYSERCQG